MKIRRISPLLQEVEIDKVKGSYNDYELRLSFGQLKAIRNALEKDHADPISDELFDAIAFYMAGNIAMPGEDQSATEKAKDSEDKEKQAEKDTQERTAPEPPKMGGDQPRQEPTPGEGDGFSDDSESFGESTTTGSMSPIDSMLPMPAGYSSKLRKKDRLKTVAKSPGTVKR
jgi:hypothetical protein